MIIQDRKEIIWKVRNQEMTPPLKMQMKRPPTPFRPSARPNAEYIRSLLHTIKKMSSFSSLDQCPPMVASPVVVLEKLEEVLGPCERGRRPLFIAALFNI
jgi:hypothetical protein